MSTGQPDTNPPIPFGDPVQTLAAVLEASDSSMTILDAAGVVRTWNPASERLFGYAAAEMIGQSAATLIADDRADTRSWIQKHVASGREIKAFDTICVSKDGRHLEIALSVLPIRDASLTVVGAIVNAHDVGARPHADLLPGVNEARWRAILDSAVDGIVVIDEAGTIEAFNAAAERMFGYSEPEVLGKNVTLLMPSPYSDEHDGYLKRYLQTGEHKIIGVRREVLGKHRDGRTFPVHLSVGKVRASGRPRFTGILHDLSSRVALEERLREQTALARVGEMAAVVAHEVRNPLAAVRAALQVIGGRLSADSRNTPVIREILSRVDGLNRLTEELLLFAHPPQHKTAAVDLSLLLRLTASLIAQDPAFHALVIDVTGTAPSLQGDPNTLKIVFQNLFINAAQAMRGHGTVRVLIDTDGDRRRVTIADEGPGMPSEVLEQALRPFFTTKARGTGLGLPIARRLLETHGGTISLECPERGGTVVTVELPEKGHPDSV